MTSTIQTSPKLDHCSVKQLERLLQSIESTLLVMPTGSGKTWTARQSLKQWAEQGYLGVYLSPLKALAQEQVNVLRRDFPHLKVGLFTGEVTENPRDVQILVATHEKFDVYLKRPKLYLDWLARIGVVVVDEIHLLADPQRGGRLESLLVRLQEVNPFVQVLGLSATLTNADELSSWLKGRVLRGGTRPVSLETEFLRYKTEEQKIDCLLSRLACGREEGGQTLIFVATRRRAETLETFLSQQGYRVKHHHSGLWPQERLEVEGAFRAGQLEVLVATPTLEMGVNLPARRVILYDTYQFNGEGFEPLSVQSFLQRIGRAGRPGLDTKGEAFVLLPAWADDGPYQRGIPEKVFSRLGRSQILSQFFLDLIEAGLAQSTEDLKWIYQRTLHAHQQSEVDLEGTLALLLDEGFIAKKEDGLRVTYLGRITARLSLSPMDLVLSRKLIDLDAKTPYDLILVVSLWSSLSPRLWCALEDIELMQEALDGMPSALLDIPVERFPVGRRLLLSAVKTLVLLSQTEEDAELAKQFGVYPVEIDRLRQALPEALNSLAQVLDPLGFPQLEQAAKDGAAIIQSGLPLEAVALLDLRGVGPVLAGRLYEQGITPNNFRQTSAEAIAQVDGISIKGAKKLLIGAEKMMQRRYSLHRYRAQTDQRPWNYSIEPYRLRRSLELKHRTTPNPALRTVYGGSEERQVLRKLDKYHCSCPDFAKRQLDCKHILYCKQVDKDQEILQAVADLPDDVQSSLRCGLATLWQSVNRRLPW